MLTYSLSSKLTIERNVGTIPGIRLTKGIEPVNRALFDVDSLLLGGSSLRIARVFQDILQRYCVVLGAMVNKIKSVVYRWNTDEQTIF